MLIVPVKEGSFFLIPQNVPYPFLKSFRVLPVAVREVFIALYLCYLSHAILGCIGIAHKVHGSHGHNFKTLWRLIALPVIRRIAVPYSIVLSGVIFAPALQTSVIVRITNFPKILVIFFKNIIELIKVRCILSCHVVNIKGRAWKAEPLELVILGNDPVPHALNASWKPSITPLIVHEYFLIV